MSPSQDLIDGLLVEHSANTAWRALADEGYEVPLQKLHYRVSQLIADGRRKPLEKVGREPGGYAAYEIAKGASLEGSERLLRAQIRAGQVFPDAMARWEARHGRVAVAA